MTSLINVALEELVRQGRELPGYTTLDKMAAKIREFDRLKDGVHAAGVQHAGEAAIGR